MAGKVAGSKLILKNASFWTIYIFVFCLIVFVSGCESRPPISFADNVPTQQRKVELKRRLERWPDDSEANFLLAQIYHSERAYADAEYYYNLALQFDPVYRPAQVGKVKLFIDQGDTVKAQHYFESCLDQIGDIPGKIVTLAREFQEQELNSYALMCFNKALSIAPKSAEVNKYMGYYYLSLNDKDKAREYFENSFDIDPKQHDVSYELGRLGRTVEYEGPVPKGVYKEE